MFNKKYDDRLIEWARFRASVESSETPLEEAVAFYATAPMVSIQMDPYDPETWLTPWELLYANEYCNFSKILAFAYTFKLTKRFIGSKIEIHICTNKQKQELDYCVMIDDMVISQNLVQPSNHYFNSYQPEVTYDVSDFV
jgi:hypothetical protein